MLLRWCRGNASAVQRFHWPGQRCIGSIPPDRIYQPHLAAMETLLSFLLGRKSVSSFSYPFYAAVRNAVVVIFVLLLFHALFLVIFSVVSCAQIVTSAAVGASVSVHTGVQEVGLGSFCIYSESNILIFFSLHFQRSSLERLWPSSVTLQGEISWRLSTEEATRKPLQTQYNRIPTTSAIQSQLVGCPTTNLTHRTIVQENEARRTKQRVTVPVTLPSFH